MTNPRWQKEMHSSEVERWFEDKRERPDLHHCDPRESWLATDARGIPIGKVCSECEQERLSRYRPEVLNDCNYDSDEPIDEVL